VARSITVFDQNRDVGSNPAQQSSWFANIDAGKPVIL
jgi:hypothetical protein